MEQFTFVNSRSFLCNRCEQPKRFVRDRGHKGTAKAHLLRCDPLRQAIGFTGHPNSMYRDISRVYNGALRLGGIFGPREGNNRRSEDTNGGRQRVPRRSNVVETTRPTLSYLRPTASSTNKKKKRRRTRDASCFSCDHFAAVCSDLQSPAAVCHSPAAVLLAC
jgi:hypothetical protein